MEWFVYIVKCSDRSLYTGITNNLSKRVNAHNLNLGAKYVRGKLPVKLVYSETLPSQVAAAKREREIKSWRREKKLKLVKYGLKSFA